MAHFSQDPNMLAIYEPGGHGDIYKDMARRMFDVQLDEVTKDQRGIQKVNVLAMGYGAGDKRVGSILTVNGYPTDVETGAAYVAEIKKMYPVFFDWREQVIARVHRTGYVQTIGGRHRRLKTAFIDRRNWKNVGYGERQAVNAIIQGSAADIVRRCMVHCDLDARLAHLLLLAQVHDELLWECAKELLTLADLALVKWHGEIGHGYELRVPLTFEPMVGDSWHEGKEGAPLELPEDMRDDAVSQEFEEER